MQAIGTFHIKLTPLEVFHQGTDAMQLGRMAIDIVDGVHHYRFDYQL